MVCIAAFIILILVGIIVAFLSIFNRELGRKYLKVLKKSWHCFSHRVTFRKCDTNFADDVKTSILKKVVIKKPTWVKPISITIEIASILIVIVTAWSLVEGIKAGLALWTLGTCNVSQPNNCALGADSCSIDEDNLNWFTEWGEIFGAISDRLKTWNADDYDLTPAFTIGVKSEADRLAKPALALIDPGCSVCMQSYRNLQKSDFFNSHALEVVIYPIQNTDGNYRFQNSELVTRYLYASQLVENSDSNNSDNSDSNSSNSSSQDSLAAKIIARIFTESNDRGTNYQAVINTESAEVVENLLKSWLKEWSDAKTVEKIAEKAKTDEVTKIIKHNKEIVDSQIKPKGIPTMLYDGKKHLGLFKN